MINSRKLDDLHPLVADMAIELKEQCAKQGIDIIFTSTYRDHESQNSLYEIGRTKAGRKVTNAKGGQSYHNWRVAFDVVPVVNGKAVWNDNNVWQVIGRLGKDIGLEWAGDWVRFKEMPHFQFTGGFKLADFQNGRGFA